MILPVWVMWANFTVTQSIRILWMAVLTVLLDIYQSCGWVFRSVFQHKKDKTAFL